MQMNKYRVVYLPTLLIEAADLEAAASAASRILLTGLTANYVTNADDVREVPVQFDITEVALDGRFAEPDEPKPEVEDEQSGKDHGEKQASAPE